MTSKTEIKNEIENLAGKKDQYQSVINAANKAKTDLTNSRETVVGKVAGEINSGVQSLTSQVNNLTGDASKLNTAPVEGLLDESQNVLTSSMESALDSVTFTAKLAPKVKWKQLGSTNAYFPEAQKTEDITKSVKDAMNAAVSDGQRAVAVAGDPKGFNKAIKDLENKVGAFDSSNVLSKLAAKANVVRDLVIAGKPSVPGDIHGAITFEVPMGDSAISLDDDFQLGYIDEINNAVNRVNQFKDNPLKVVSEELDNALGGLGSKLVNDVKSAVDEVEASINSVVDKANKFIDNTFASLTGSVNTNNGFIQNINREGQKLAKDTVRNLAPDLTEDEVNEVVTKAQGTEKELSEATQIVKNKSRKPVEEIRLDLSQLDTTIAGTSVIGNENSAFADPFELQGAYVGWETGTPRFFYISSFEELEAEFNTIDREVTEMVVHWSETFTNKNIGAEEIDSIHRQLGLTGIGYHYVIRRDGSLQRGRPVNRRGEHASINGHDEYSIGVCFVGGLNCSSETPNPETFLSADSLTRAQMNTFYDLCSAFYNAFPGGQILGHNDLDITQSDPGFDVRDYVFDVFNKPSIFEDPKSEGPFSPQDLIKKEIPTS